MIDPLLSLLIAILLAAGTALLLWPKKGLLARRRDRRRLTSRVRTEDTLKYVLKCEMKGQSPTLEGIAGVLPADRDEVAGLLARMQDGGLVILDGETIALTPSGRNTALHILRAHRLWESYLAEETGYDEATWHGRADDLEHELSAKDLNQLSYRLGNPTHDPHGDPIPTSKGYIVTHGGQPLTMLDVDTPARIVHLEDEPELVYAQLVAEGLHPGMPVRMVESTAQRVRFWANGDEHLLAPIVARNISVLPITEPVATEEQPSASLASLPVGDSATVRYLSAACRGQERRRFLDLGILPGTQITAEFGSPSGDPVAYRVRGALIALRSDQARLIRIEPALEMQE